MYKLFSRKWFEESIYVGWRGLAVALLYAAAYLVSRKLSVDQWYLPAGIRVAALLLFPYRYWPYLFLGEFSAVAYLRYSNYELISVILSASITMPVVAYIVHKHRRRMRSDDNYWLLSIAILAAVAGAALTMFYAKFLMASAGVPMTVAKAFEYTMGHYLGILMVAPLAVLWMQRKSVYVFPRRLALDGLALIVIMAGLYISVSMLPPPAVIAGAKLPDYSIDANQTLRILMMAPAVVMTFLHGWRGAVLGVVAANVCISLTMPNTKVPGAHDSEVYFSQQLLALAATALLGLGAHMSHYYRKARYLGFAEKQASRIARLSFVSSERVLGARASRLKAFGEESDLIFKDVVELLKERGHHQAAMDVLRLGGTHSRKFKEQLNLIFPEEIEEYGLYGALDTPVLAEVWGGAEIERQLRGYPRELSLGLQLASYRCICDGIAALADVGHERMYLQVRCGRFVKRKAAWICITPLDGPIRFAPSNTPAALEALEARVLAYGGIVHRRKDRISVLIDESVDVPGGAYGAGLETDHSTVPPLT